MFFYDDLHFSADLLEYLVEYCVSKGSTSIHYLKKVGLAWQESGIRDVASAKQETTTFNKHNFESIRHPQPRTGGKRSRDDGPLAEYLRFYD